MLINYVLRHPSGEQPTVDIEGAPRDVALEAARSLFLQDGPFDYDPKKRAVRRFSPPDFIAKHFEAEWKSLESPREGFRASVDLSNEQVATTFSWIMLSGAGKRRAWLVLAILLAELRADVLNAPPKYISEGAARATKARKAFRRGALVALGVLIALIVGFRILWDVFRPRREFNKALHNACDRYLARVSSEPGLFSYLKSRELCRLAVKVASDRRGNDSRVKLVHDAVFDSCLLLATDPSEPKDTGGPDEIEEDFSPPRYTSIPAHFAREYVDKCEAAGREIADDVDVRRRLGAK